MAHIPQPAKYLGHPWKHVNMFWSKLAEQYETYIHIIYIYICFGHGWTIQDVFRTLECYCLYSICFLGSCWCSWYLMMLLFSSFHKGGQCIVPRSEKMRTIPQSCWSARFGVEFLFSCGLAEQGMSLCTESTTLVIYCVLGRSHHLLLRNLVRLPLGYGDRAVTRTLKT